MKLQFFYIGDLCRLIDAVLTKKPAVHILNAGNSQPISVRQWVELCYQAAGKRAEFVETAYPVNQRDFFSFYDYEYQLDVSRQAALLDKVTPMEAGLAESYRWYRGHKDEVNRKGANRVVNTDLVEEVNCEHNRDAGYSSDYASRSD